ncbi:MAG: hypothetical protein Q8P20_02135 [bacterium]|nr:hypothetical protein [bacterium]
MENRKINQSKETEIEKIISYVDLKDKTLRIGIIPTVMFLFVLQIIIIMLIQKVYHNWFFTVILIALFVFFWLFAAKKERDAMKKVEVMKKELIR